jgi:glycosyltransferase involved in cell wall biosynthesis
LKSVVSTVSNDINTDNRVHKIALTLLANGYNITIVGRKFRNSKDLSDRPYKTKRFKLLFNKGPLFYMNLNFRLFIYLLRSREDIILSNDLDTLPACWLAASLRKKKLVYDSHELFPELPELVNRRLVKKIWSFLEKRLINKINLGLTVSPSIAEYYIKTYHVSFEVIKNVGKFRFDHELEDIQKNADIKIIMYQGALNVGRGIELAIQSMAFIDHAILIIAGTGDIEQKLKRLAAELGLEKKVRFTGRLSFDELWQYTRNADLGISLEEDLGLNYRYALPNKLFDYIQSRLPVIVSDLPEMKKIVGTYKIGEVLTQRLPENLAKIINRMFTIDIPDGKYTTKLALAARELCWEKEEEKLRILFKQLYT